MSGRAFVDIDRMIGRQTPFRELHHETIDLKPQYELVGETVGR